MARFPRVPRGLIAALALALGVSCTNPVCGCTSAPPGALLQGHVTRPDGTAMVFATIVVEVSDAGCAEPFTSAGFPRTEEDGSYRWYVHGAEEAGVCIRAHAAPPAHLATLRTSDTVTVPVQLTREGETVRMDFALRPR